MEIGSGSESRSLPKLLDLAQIQVENILIPANTKFNKNVSFLHGFGCFVIFEYLRQLPLR